MTQTPLERNVLYPSCETLDEVRDKALAMLPITSQNDLLMLLGIQHNTLLNIMEKEIVQHI